MKKIKLMCLNHLTFELEKALNKKGLECDLNYFDVSDIIELSDLFCESKFRGNISKWNVSNVKYMDSTFSNSSFNNDISKWNVSNVVNMFGTFSNSSFNRDISKWNVSNVTNMNYTFESSLFNHDISNWNVSSVCIIYNTFDFSLYKKSILNFKDRVFLTLNLNAKSYINNQVLYKNIIKRIKNIVYNLNHKIDLSYTLQVDYFDLDSYNHIHNLNSNRDNYTVYNINHIFKENVELTFEEYEALSIIYQTIDIEECLNVLLLIDSSFNYNLKFFDTELKTINNIEDLTLVTKSLHFKYYIFTILNNSKILNSIKENGRIKLLNIMFKIYSMLHLINKFNKSKYKYIEAFYNDCSDYEKNFDLNAYMINQCELIRNHTEEKSYDYISFIEDADTYLKLIDSFDLICNVDLNEEFNKNHLQFTDCVLKVLYEQIDKDYNNNTEEKESYDYNLEL